MFESISTDKDLTKEEQYSQQYNQIKVLIEPEDDLVANLANISAVLKYNFNFFWVGFYLLKNNELVLNAFQGPVACTRIKIGKGVCGTAFEKNETIIVPNINLFEGHIACSSETKSEIVVPILVNNTAVGVLDIDSEYFDNFDETDRIQLEKISQLIAKKW